MRTLILLVASALLVAACTERDGGPASTPAAGAVLVRAIAVAGPTCPVVTEPPDPACEDRPVEGARVLVRAADGSEVATVVTDADGRLSIALPPGTYELVPQPVEGLMGTAAPVAIVVEDGAELEPVTLAYDTGIR